LTGGFPTTNSSACGGVRFNASKSASQRRPPPFFKNGRRQAIRLSKAFRVTGSDLFFKNRAATHAAKNDPLKLAA
jgi:hypothetical protein